MELAEIIDKLALKPSSAKLEFAVKADDLAETVSQAVNVHGLALANLFAAEKGKHYEIRAALRTGGCEPFVTLVAELDKENPHYPSVTAKVMAAHWYERLMGDGFGIVAVGHPDWRRLEHHENIPAGTHPLKKDFAWDAKLDHAAEEYPMHRVEGKGIFEIPVGPIHAGIIEPGHFRFNVMGERIVTLEGKLFFKHKGVEKIMEGKTPEEALPFAERVSGDMAIGHGLAFCQAAEAASGTDVPARALALRTVLNEWERVIMHLHDISNIGGNGTALTFMWAQGARLVERCRRMSEKLWGHRFLRGALALGGVSRDLSKEAQDELIAELDYIVKELAGLEKVARNSDSFMERLETTGVLKLDAAIAYGALGLPARASGVNYDVRVSAPYAAYGGVKVNVALGREGDVADRFFLRFAEIREATRIIKEVLETLPAGDIKAGFAAKSGEALGYSESWRGEVLDWIRLDKKGLIERVVIRDPSFCNWPLFGELGPGNIVPDFPLCNKSLNLSYSGTDL